MSEIERIRSEHVQAGDPGDPHCADCSDASYPIWPCDAAILLDRLAAVTAERDALREAGDAYRAALAEYERGWDHESDQQWRDRMNAAHERLQETHDALIAALAARGGEVAE